MGIKLIGNFGDSSLTQITESSPILTELEAALWRGAAWLLEYYAIPKSTERNSERTCRPLALVLLAVSVCLGFPSIAEC